MHVPIFVIVFLSPHVVSAFHHPYNLPPPLCQREWRKEAATVISRRRTVVVQLSSGKNNSKKGFGGGSSASASPFSPSSARSASSRRNKKPIVRQPTKVKNVKDIERNLVKKYGGTSPEAIAQGTQAAMDAALQALPDHVQRAARLYQSIRRWDAHCNNNRLSIIEQTTMIDPAQWANMQRARDEYQRLCNEFPHDVSDHRLQQLYQRLTWDAAADAKAARVALTGGGTMKADLKLRIRTACKWVKESLEDDDSSSLICLDVGCGYGAIVPDLLEAGLRAKQIHGLDLSTEMIRHAQTMYEGPKFEVASFYDFSSPLSNVGAIIFCSSLHDLPDIPAAIRHASSLLHKHQQRTTTTTSSSPSSQQHRPRFLVLVHAQGAQHVVSQMHANPVLVPRPLPDESELRDWAAQCGMRLVVAPAAPATPRDVAEGYLAVLETTASTPVVLPPPS